MRLIILFCLIILSHLVNAETDKVYKCQITDKQFIYQPLPCAAQTTQKTLDIEKQTPEQIERAKQLIEQAKQERQLLDVQEKQRLESERMKQQAIIEKQQAEAKAALATQTTQAQPQNSGSVITSYEYYPYYGGYPYYNGYSYNHEHLHHNAPALQTSPYPFYSPNRTGANFAPYPNVGRQFAPYPNINPNPPPAPRQPSYHNMQCAVPTR